MITIPKFLCILLVSLFEISLSSNDQMCPSVAQIENGIHEYEIVTNTLNYSCHLGYQLEGSSKRICINGTWSPADPPTCVQTTHDFLCAVDPYIPNGKLEYNQDESLRGKSSLGTVTCDPGFSSDDTFQTSFVIVCGPHGIWTMPDGNIRISSCTRKYCPTPPDIPKAQFRYEPYNTFMSDGFVAEYKCFSGYSLVGSASTARLVCRNGQWEGPIPTCVLKEVCVTPPYIQYGNWNLITKSKQDISLAYEQGEMSYSKYAVGTEVEYTCQAGYKLVGARVLQCLSNQEWSNAAPICIPVTEQTWYCPDIGQIKNGLCKCMGEDTPDLTLCRPFRRGIKIECTCLQGYKLQGVVVLTCTHSSSLNIGVWDWDLPRCYPDSDVDLIPDGHNDGKSFSSGDIRDGKNKGSSLVIVVTTACSVLGVLLLIMVIVVIRRKKPRPHLFQQGPTPPPYARVHNNSLDEHDRMALMAYANASAIHLPSYEEAVRPNGVNAGLGVGTAGVGRTPGPTGSGHHGLQRTADLHRQNIGGDGNNNINNNNNNNSNRHSTVTTSTMNRDGVSEMFGSMDTVNVSMSDASTSVTVETFDSGTSSRSMASQRATAGSLNSSDDQLANVNDDAPLLDSSSQREIDVVSMSSNPSRSSKEDP